MPGLLTPERRKKVKRRSRANHGGNKKSPENKTKTSSSPYQMMTEEAPSKSKAVDTTSPNTVMVQPRTVTPTASSGEHSSRSYKGRWKDYDEDDSTAGLVANSPPSPLISSPSYYNADEIMYASDEEMPMDELMGMKNDKNLHRDYNLGSTNSILSNSQKSIPPRNTERKEKSSKSKNTKSTNDVLGLSNIMKMVTPSNWNNGDDLGNSAKDSNSAAGSEGRTTGIQGIIAALENGSMADEPSNLSREERILWESFQTAIVNDRNQHLEREMKLQRQQAEMEQKYTAMSIVAEKRKDGEDSIDDAANTDGKPKSGLQDVKQVKSLEEELQAKDSLLKEQEDNHVLEVLAIQRVLADITTQKMELEEKLQQQQSSKGEDGIVVTGASEDVDKLKAELIAAKQEMEAARREADESTAKINTLESDYKDARAKLSDSMEEYQKLAVDSETSTTEIEKLRNELKILNGGNGRASLATEDEYKARIAELEADISAQKLEYEKIHVDKMEIEVARASASDEAERLKARNELLEQEVKKANKECEHAVTELKSLKQELENVQKEKEAAANEVEKLRKAREHAVNEVEKAIVEARAVKSEHPAIDESISANPETKNEKEDVEPSVSQEDFEKLQKTLTETSASLETSKQIIASLEKANGSLALDSRTKLKEKDEELSVVQKESDERKRLLDSLATELRDLQRKQGDIEVADRRTKAQVIKQKALMERLETSLSDLQAAVVVHESCISNDSNIDNISEILGDTLHAISATLDSTEQFVDEIDDASAVDTDVEHAEINSEVGRRVDAIVRNDREATSRGLKYELDQKKIAVKRLEEALKKQNEDMRRMRSQFDARGRGGYGNSNSNDQLRAEIQSLRQQCSTNMEVLAKKERELSVLRSSLKVDDNESGYISDDASDEEDEDDGTEVGSIMSAPKLNAYGPADAEAYATILSQANGRIGMPGTAQVKEIESLKKDLMEALGEKESASKELQARRESLANAKMIISSLEKANKGMMEDLRSRLQDSNTAISSLLEKSKEHEKEAVDLREKLQRLEQEKVEERERMEAELGELRKASRHRDGEDGSESPLEEKKEEILGLDN